MVHHSLGDLFQYDGVDKQWEITAVKDDNIIAVITNDHLTDRGVMLNEVLCESEELRFGSFSASDFSFEVRNTMVNLKDAVLTVRLYLGEDRSDPFPVGVYRVKSDTPAADRKTRSVIAYDDLARIIETDVADWYEELFPETTTTVPLIVMRNSFCDYLDIQQDSIPLVNDDFMVTKTLKLVDNENKKSVLSGKDVLRCICEANGCFCRIGREGKLEYVYLSQAIQGLYPNMPDDLERYPNDKLYPREINSRPIGKSSYVAPCAYEDFITDSIGRVEIRNEDGSTLIWEGDDNANTYLVTENFLFYGRTESEIREAAKNLLRKITNIRYRPFTTGAIGDLTFECGDPIRLSTTYCLIESYILKRTFQGGRHLEDAYGSEGVEQYVFDVNNTNVKMMEQLNGLRRELVVSAGELLSRITNETTNRQSEIRQLEGEIGIRVQNGQVISKLSLNENGLEFIGKRVAITANNFSVDALGNAFFKGNIEGSTISGTSFISKDGEGINSNIVKIGDASIEVTRVRNGDVGQIAYERVRIGGGAIQLSFEDDHVQLADGTRISYNAISTPSLKVDGSLVLTEANIKNVQGLTVPKADLAANALRAGYATEAGTADEAKKALSVENHSVNSYYGLTCTKSNGGVDDNGLIWIGTAWRAVSLSYFNEHSGGTSSDRKLKQNIVDVDDKYIDILDKLELKNFQFKSRPDKTRCGLIAQEVQSVLEDLGIEDSDIVLNNVNDAGEESLGVDYVQLLTLLIPAYKNLRKEHDDLIQTLKDKGVI